MSLFLAIEYWLIINQKCNRLILLVFIPPFYKGGDLRNKEGIKEPTADVAIYRFVDNSEYDRVNDYLGLARTRFLQG